ncbi:MAG: hypothetical protein ABIJ16_06315, partial [Bacteroidota bacterium]
FIIDNLLFMFRALFITITILLSTCFSFSQTTEPDKGSESEIKFDYVIISGSFGAGGVISTNIVNSGAVIPTSLDFLAQTKHQRFGLGYTHELYLTPENLGKLLIGESSNVEKFYFIYEWTIFNLSPVNIGFSGQLGGFTVGSESEYGEDGKSRLFGNIGAVVELGAPRFYLFARPAIEYKSYDAGSWHKEILGTVSIGLRWKIMTEEERKRRGKSN